MGVFDTIDINIRGQVDKGEGEKIEKLIEYICDSHNLECDIKGGFCEYFREDLK